MKIIGLDVGEKRIGIARADSATRIAVPAGTVEVDGSELIKIGKVAKLLGTDLFILGLPRSNEGNETAQSTFVKNFAKKLKTAIPTAKIKFQDESLTSVVAEERLKKRKKRYEKGEIDAEAATVILQDFLEGLKKEKMLEGKAGEKSSEKSPEETLKKSRKKSDASAYKNSEKTEIKKKKKAKDDGKKKSKNPLIIIVSIVLAVAILLGSAILVIMAVKDARAKARAEEYARIEREMKAEVFNFTILPGETVRDVRERLIETGYPETEVDEALKPSSYNFEFLSGLDSLEGYLYGETIEFYSSASAKEVIERFLEEMERVISENNLSERYALHGLSLHQGIILASIVQKEAYASEQATVAQIFYSRLEYGWKLGSDVTVKYALDLIDPERTTYSYNADSLQIDSCYNTRVYTGLPCGAISNPSLSALLAVAEPSDTDYLYFLTGDDGMMYYSYTESEHNQNIYLHCQELCNLSL